MTSTVSLPISREISTYNEISMHQSLLFSDSLKDLKNLRSQLYSAAEYFELSYTTDDPKQSVVDTLKDYTIKALVNTVDHLGSVTYKVSDLLDEKVDEVYETEIGLSCIQQRLRTCQEYVDHEGLSEQSLIINTPKYHKRYILPVGETMHVNCSISKYQDCSFDDEVDWHCFKNSDQSTIKETPTSTESRGQSPSPSQKFIQRSVTFSFLKTQPKKDSDKRSVSPYRFPLLRSASVSRPTTPNSRRPTSPNLSKSTIPNNISLYKRYPSEPRRSISMNVRVNMEQSKDVEQYSKGKRFLKALLSRRKSKKDDTLHTYLNEY